MIDRVAAMLNYFLDHLAGPQSKKFKVSLSFSPHVFFSVLFCPFLASYYFLCFFFHSKACSFPFFWSFPMSFSSLVLEFHFLSMFLFFLCFSSLIILVPFFLLFSFSVWFDRFHPLTCFFLKVKEQEKYGFYPVELLGRLVQIYIFLNKENGAFAKAIDRSEKQKLKNQKEKKQKEAKNRKSNNRKKRIIHVFLNKENGSFARGIDRSETNIEKPKKKEKKNKRSKK